MNPVKKFSPEEIVYTLPNGLRVHLEPRQNYHQMAAMITVDFGARDRDFTWENEDIHQPAGIAHFLEHRIFKQADHDAFTKLSALGADTNAFTSQARTTYYFNSLANNQDALTELLTFTQEVFLTEEDVAREAQIIMQEADQYADDPDGQLYRGLMAQLYPQDALADEIVGDHDSLTAITVQDLELAFNAFYQPENMDIYIAGAFDVAQTKATIAASLAGQRPKQKQATRLPISYRPSDERPLLIDIPTNRNKVALGMRWDNGGNLATGKDALREILAVSLALDLVFGEFSPTYMDWYNDGLIDDNFAVDMEWERGFAFISVVGDTGDVPEFVTQIKSVLGNLPEQFAALTDAFQYAKMDALSRAIQRLNFLEGVVTHFEGQTFAESTIADDIQILRELTISDVAEILEKGPQNTMVEIIAHAN
ncbi:EF-P 5-aminopentanol modification-associated protein YfmH [Weissella tructae]|uniref:AlbF protein n=2 Tax=Weissella TaxID=46255 RepID=A0A075TVY9_9LACO|nr:MULTISPECIES: pitrilysin family protein [Weissella]AIG65734.1 AlbF protein [Weissella tructae]AIM63050.1 AlbF protein [Weissella ceti]AIM64449.1 AlbF protein [Weissella ceti]ELA06813.1 Zn-dependent peptidase [Weissella ceti NC36]QVV90899.1 insulinase family protein [Weissella tructae]